MWREDGKAFLFQINALYKTPVFSTIIATIIALPISYILVFKNFRAKFIVEFFTILPLGLPPVITGYALLIIFSPNYFLGSIIYDLAAEQGGNSAFSEPGKTNLVNGCTTPHATLTIQQLSLNERKKIIMWLVLLYYFYYSQNDLPPFTNNLFTIPVWPLIDKNCDL